MNKDWTDIIKQSALEGGAKLPDGDFELLQSKYGSHRRRAAWKRTAVSVSSIAATLVAAALLWPSRTNETVEIDSPIQLAETPEIQETIVEESVLVDLLPSTPTTKVSQKEQIGVMVVECFFEDSEEKHVETIQEKFERVEKEEEKKEGKVQSNQEEIVDWSDPVPARKHRRFSIGASGNYRKTFLAYAPTTVSPMAASTKASFYAAEATPEDDYRPISYAHIPIPMEFGLSVRAELSDHLSLLSGLKYTALISNCGMPDRTFKVQNVHYLGVPITLDYSWQTRNLTFYAGGGVLAEKSIYARRGEQKLHESGLQCALLANAGVEYSISRHIGLYVEPELNRYLTQSSFTTRRSSSQWNMGANIGIRFNFD